MDKIDNKAEKLITVERTKSQVEEMISNLDILGTFEDPDKILSEEFKRIYHMGTDQLDKFIKLLVELGPLVEIETVLYYKRSLLLGPLVQYVLEYKGEPYWKDMSDSLGRWGNMSPSTNTRPIWDSSKVTDIPTDIFNHLPKFAQEVFTENAEGADSALRDSFIPTVATDNTLPMIDKNNGGRLGAEMGGGHNSAPHGNILVKDVETLYKDVIPISPGIFGSVESHLDTPYDWRIYKYHKTLNPFDPEDNVSVVEKYIVERSIERLGEVFEIATNMFGDQYKSFDKMDFELNVDTEEKVKAFKLHTVKGQLGSGEAVVQKPI